MTAEKSAEKKGIRRTVLVVCGLSSFLTPFMGSSINVAIPGIGRDFSMTAVSLGWVVTAYHLAAAMFLVPLGRYADIKGRKKIFALGLSVLTIGSSLAALAPSGGWLMAFRALQGLGGAMIFGTGVAILASVFPPGERGKALGINTSAIYIGLSLGPVVGGFLVKALGWRSIFWVTVPFSLTALALVLSRLEGEWADAAEEKFDLAGSVVLGTGLVLLMFGFSKLPAAAGIVLTTAGIFLLAFFVSLEARVPSPVLDLGLFLKNRIFAFSNLAALINYSATFTVGFLLSLYLQYIKGLPPQEAGLILLAQPLVQALTSPFAGRLSDRIEPRIIASAGMAVTSAGLLLLSFLKSGSQLVWAAGILAWLGLGFGLFSSPNTNAVMGSVERKCFGTASATLGTMRLSGQMFGAGITLMIFALFLGEAPITPILFPKFLASLRMAFILYAGVCFLGIFVSLARGTRNREEVS